MAGKSDPLAIPDFLRRAKDGSFMYPKAKPKLARGTNVSSIKVEDPVEAVLSSLESEPELKAHILKEVSAGRAQRHWLLDSSTIQLFRDEIAEKAARHAAGMARLAALKEERRKQRAEAPPKPVYGAGISIRVLAKENPRKEGTGSYERFAKMAAFVKKNPKASVAEVMAATGYRKDDLEWDESRGWVKTDVISQAPAAKPVKAKKEK